MKRVLVAGVSVLDFVFQVAEFPRAPEKYRAEDALIVGGGNAANAATAIARLDGHAMLAARLGDDQIADLIMARLNADNVDCTLVRRFEEFRSSFSAIYVDPAGERQIMNYRDNGLTMDSKWLDDSIPEKLDAVLGETRWPDGARVAMEAARAHGVPGVMDAEEPVGDSIEALMAASHVAFSAQGAADFTGESDPEQAALSADNMLAGKVLVTDGENGVVQIIDRKPVWYPAFPITPVDTLGAGDVWHGAFTLALAEGMSEPDAIRFASAAGALKCQNPGGSSGAPMRNEVDDFLKEHL